jgi:uncharacterized protein (TIGR03083 family)
VEGDAGARYRVARLKLSTLLAEQPDEAWDLAVPACPGWSVRGTVSHLLGNVEDAMAGRLTGPPTDEQVADQIGRHAEGPAVALLDEWADAAEAFEPIVSQAGIWVVVLDVLTHTQDVRGALGLPGGRDDEDAALMARMVASTDLPARLVFDVGDEQLATNPVDGPTHRVATTAFEVARIRFGRRSPEQVLAMDWHPPLPAIPDGLFIFGPRDTALVE